MEAEWARDINREYFWAYLRDVEFNTGMGIGDVALPNYNNFPNQIMTLTYQGTPDFNEPLFPYLGQRTFQSIYYWYLDWDPVGPMPQRDYVFWLYSNIGFGDEYSFLSWDRVPVEVHIPPFSNLNNSVVPWISGFSWGRVPQNDNLFLPGQQGVRIISNDWKYAPWERYPHLM